MLTEFAEFSDVFDYSNIAQLPPAAIEHAIDLREGKEPPFLPLYNLSVTELSTLREYLIDVEANGQIQRSESAAGAPILFVLKKDSTLRLCVDYRGLNKVTIKNRHPLPLISKTLDRLGGAKVFSKIDLKDAYYRIPIKREDRQKTTFRTRYGYFEYLVMLFGLTNVLATFQAYINKALAGLIDDFYVVYLNNILIYSIDYEEYTQYVRQVLKRLRKYALYASLKKCEFFIEEVEFLGFIIGVVGVSIDKRRVEIVKDQPRPSSYYNV